MRSLDPYDKILKKTICKCERFNKIDVIGNEIEIVTVTTTKL